MSHRLPQFCGNQLFVPNVVHKHCFKQGGQGCFDINECSIAEGVIRHFSDHCEKNSLSSPWQHNGHCKKFSHYKHEHRFFYTPFEIFALSASSKWQLQINYCGQNTNCNNWPGNLFNNRLLNCKKTEIVVHGKNIKKKSKKSPQGTFECNEDDCKTGYTNWRANYGDNITLYIQSWWKHQHQHQPQHQHQLDDKIGSKIQVKD